MGEGMNPVMDAVVLMYHQIRPDNVRPDWVPNQLADPWYGVSRGAFREQLAYISDQGIPVLSLADFFGEIQRPERLAKGPAVIITFDDGYSTDLDEAAPLLAEHGYPATFFLATSRMGESGMMKPADIRTLDSGLFTVGSHGATHRFLTSLDEQSLVFELESSRDKLTAFTGRPPEYLSVPGGRHNLLVREKAREIGFSGILTSEIGVARSTQRLRIPRVVVSRDMSLKSFARLLDPSSGLFKTQMAKSWMKKGIRKFLRIQ